MRAGIGALGGGWRGVLNVGARGMANYVNGVELRREFEQNLSRIYAKEVPLYAQLLPVVEEINEEARKKSGKSAGKPLVQEHHGAIRVGTPEELHNMSRLFRVMNMYPVNYYDLSVAGLPVHSTAFRDVTKEGLDANAFRVFCSLLRHEMLPEELQPLVNETLAKRQIISDGAMEMIQAYEKQGGLTEEQAKVFVQESGKTFQRQKKAIVPKEFYEKLLITNSLLADIVSFANPHINHLTPRTDDIDKLFDKLHDMGITTTPIIQGPPKREVPILLRQMAFQAIMETFLFPDGKGGYEEGGHRARFGEYETKEDAAVTPKGRELYDATLDKVRSKVKDTDPSYVKVLNEEFKAFPDNLEELRDKGLVYMRYSVNQEAVTRTQKEGKHIPEMFEDAVKQGYVSYEPVEYYDFLPVSAAGIFKSNLVEGGFTDAQKTKSDQAGLEKALGRSVIDSFTLYATQEAESKLQVAQELNLKFASKAEKSKLEELVRNNPAKHYSQQASVKTRD